MVGRRKKVNNRYLDDPRHSKVKRAREQLRLHQQERIERARTAHTRQRIKEKRRLLGTIVRMNIAKLSMHREKILASGNLSPPLQEFLSRISLDDFRKVWLKSTRKAIQNLRNQLPEE